MARYYRITASCRLLRVETIKRFAENTLSIVLAGGLLLTIVAYYLGAKPQVSAFPTYLCGLAWLSLCLFPGRFRQMRSNGLVALCAVLIFYLAISTAWSNAGSFETTLRYIGFALLLLGFVAGILLTVARWPAFAPWLVTVTILSGVVSALYSFYFFYGLDFHPLVEKYRLYALGRIHNPAVGAFSYAVPLVFAAYRTIARKTGDERILWGACTLILADAVFMTDTRSVWVGLLAAAVAGVLFSGRLTLQTRLTLAGAVIAISCLGVYAALHSPWRGDIVRRSTSFRPEIWSSTLHRMSGTRWLVGHGDNTPSSVREGRFTFDHPHSIYLATLFYGGAIGLALLLALIAATFYALIRTHPGELRNLTLAALIFGAVSLLFDGDYLLDKIDYVWIVFWLPVALAACVLQRRYA